MSEPTEEEAVAEARELADNTEACGCPHCIRRALAIRTLLNSLSKHKEALALYEAEETFVSNPNGGRDV